MTQDRVMVRAGTVKVGDMMDGQRVTGLGRAWVLDEEHNCGWGAHPNERVRVQYAYMDDAAPTPQVEREQPSRAHERRQQADADRRSLADRLLVAIADPSCLTLEQAEDLARWARAAVPRNPLLDYQGGARKQAEAMEAIVSQLRKER